MVSRAADRARSTPPLLPDALTRLFDAVREGIYIGTLDGQYGSTLAANPHLKLMFGFAPEADASEVQPFARGRFVDPKARDLFVEQLSRDGAVTDYVLRLRRADETPIWVEVTANLDATSNGNSAQVQALLRDVSERRRLEDQDRGVYQDLLQAEKLAALGQTVSGVAHELNNPLATILTWSERLASRSVDAVTRRGIETILGESERAARIVRNLLTFARKRHSTRSMVDLNQVVRETLALRGYEQRLSNIRTIEALATGLPRLFADPHHLKQVLLNLMINAEQAMRAANGRGTLVIRTWHDPGGDAVVLEVNDDGPGMPPDVQSKIFDPFFTTKAVGKGTGLGLTVAFAIVRDHGGQLRVASEPGRGASFFLELPTSSGVPARPAPPAVPPPPAVGAGTPVLVIEDEPALAEAVSAALTDAGYRVDRATDGQDALDRLRERVYDLIICDLAMPRVDGPAFFRALAESRPALTKRIVFVTGNVAGTDAERFLEDTGCRWLAKPFRLGDLLQAAREVTA